VNELDNVEFEERLKRDLRRIDAPEGFADRVMQRVPQQRQGRLLSFPGVGMRARHLMAVAAVLLVAMILGFGVHHVEQVERQRELKQEQAKARAAAEQFALAMQVTGRTLFVVQQQIDRAGTKSMHGVD
jgi:uncharacterized protein HemX